MNIALYSLTSSLHSEVNENVSRENFITDIEDALGCKFEYMGRDWATFGTHDLDLIYVRTGGTEGAFKSLNLRGEIRLLTSGKSNSLAASMEILSYLNRNGQRGEILHGSPEYIAGRLLAVKTLRRQSGKSESDQKNGSDWIRPLPTINLGGIRLGVIGKPSDWLISSEVDYAEVRSKLNAELVDIPMSELLSRIDCPENELRSFRGSEAIHDALCRMVSDFKLGGITLRCFDLLDSVHNTGCLALARLNAAGIAASCEGDIPALLTMAWLQQQRGCPGFQCNLSRINGDELLFAHCTIPLNMVKSYKYDTHFESGIGTAIKGEMPAGQVEIVKIAPDLGSYVSIPGEIIRNCAETCLCRTQIIVKAEGAAQYLLNSPLANHHIISYR